MSSPKTILILNWTLRIGGVERKIADLANYLAETGNPGGHKFYLILMERPPANIAERAFFDQVAGSEIEILYLPQTKVGRFNLEFPPSLFVLWHTLRLRPDVCFGFLRRLGMLAVVVKQLLFWREMKVVIGEDTYSSKSLAEEIPWRPFSNLVGSMMGWLFPKADLVISPSEAAKHDLVDTFKVPSRQISVLKNWISTPVAAQTSPKDYDVVFAGRLEPVKDVSFLIRALSETAKSRPQLRACIVGDGSQRAKLQHLAAELNLADRVDFVGYRDDVGTFLSRGKVFCISSTYEGLPMTVLEAMSHGLPTVARNFAGAEELVVDDETGYVCEHVGEFSNRILEILDNRCLRERLGEQARRNVDRDHSRANIGRLLDLLTAKA